MNYLSHMVITTKEELIDYVHAYLEDDECAETVVMYEDMEEAFLGIAKKDNLLPCLVYDYWKLVDLTMKNYNLDLDEAIVNVDSELINEDYGPQSPIVIMLCRKILR